MGDGNNLWGSRIARTLRPVPTQPSVSESELEASAGLALTAIGMPYADGPRRGAYHPRVKKGCSNAADGARACPVISEAMLLQLGLL